MTAIVEIGSKQYLVSEQSEIYVEKIDQKVGSTISFNNVLMVDNNIGNPYVKGATITCEVLKQGKQPKLTVIHHISQKHHTKKYGHRQPYTKLVVKTINIK